MAYTAQKVFDITLGLMNESANNSPSFKTYFLPTLNTVLGEILEQENLLRYRDGMEELKTAPFIEDMEDEIPYHDELIRNVIPWGVGMILWLGDDELERATFFSTKYDENRTNTASAVYVEVEDCY